MITWPVPWCTCYIAALDASKAKFKEFKGFKEDETVAAPGGAFRFRWGKVVTATTAFKKVDMEKMGWIGGSHCCCGGVASQPGCCVLEMLGRGKTGSIEQPRVFSVSSSGDCREMVRDKVIARLLWSPRDQYNTRPCGTIYISYAPPALISSRGRRLPTKGTSIHVTLPPGGVMAGICRRRHGG